MFSTIRILVFLLLFPSLALAEVIDRVVAVVNDDLITLSELNNEGALHFEKIREQAPLEERAQALAEARQTILSGLIERKLIAQRAAKRGITIQDEEIEMQYFRIMEQNNLTEEAFKAELAKAGITPKMYKNNLRSQIIRQRLISVEIRSKVVITNEQIEEYYSTQYGQQGEGDGLHILQIGCLWGQGGKSANKNEAQMRAKQLRGMVMAGENFKEIAKSYSDLPSAVDGGDIGIFLRDELSTAMQEGLTGLRPGEVSNIIESGKSFQFFKLLSTKSGSTITQAPLETVREEIRALLHEQRLKEKFDLWVTQLRELSYVKEQL
ncbi:MAG: SurA N-terminal domain-containing protein [Thermodesulfobacteriota bacterium]